METTQLLLTAKQVAALLSISWRTVYRLSDSGKMPRPLKLSGSTRWNKEIVLRWIDLECPPRKRFEAIMAQERKEVARAS